MDKYGLTVQKRLELSGITPHGMSYFNRIFSVKANSTVTDVTITCILSHLTG